MTLTMSTFNLNSKMLPAVSVFIRYVKLPANYQQTLEMPDKFISVFDILFTIYFYSINTVKISLDM